MNDTAKLITSIIIDAFGYVSYIVPGFGELLDIVVAPVTAWWIYYAYDSKAFAILGFTEEAMFYILDFIPSCTIAHVFSVLKKGYGD